MNKFFWIIITIWFLGTTLLVYNLKAPLTATEVKEGYTAYSLLKTGTDTNNKFSPLVFEGDGNYLSFFGVYLRIIPIALFGLNMFGIRFAGIVVGVVTAYLFWRVLKKYLDDEKLILISTLLFLVSPLFIKSVIFNIGELVIFAIVLISIFNRRIFKSVVIIFLLSIIYTALFQRAFIKNIYSKTFLSDLHPKNYTYLIDKRLSFGLIYESDLITQKFNFNRISLNKVYFGVNQVFISLIKPFNFEALVSPIQSSTILGKDLGNQKSFPSLYFWEIPILLIGFLFLNLNHKKFQKYLLLPLVLIILFKGKYMLMLLPFFVINEAHIIKDRINYFIIGILYLIGIYSIVDIVMNKYEVWSTDIDNIQNKIWMSVTDENIKNNKIYVTDRFGEPVYYYLVYKNIDPSYYKNNRVEGALLNGTVRRVESVGNIFFRSFNFANEKKESNQIWIGTGVDFGEKNNDIQINKI